MKSELLDTDKERMIDTQWFERIISRPHAVDAPFLRVAALQCTLHYKPEKILNRTTHTDNLYVLGWIETSLFEMLNRHHITPPQLSTTTSATATKRSRKKTTTTTKKKKKKNDIVREKPEWALSITDPHHVEDALLAHMRRTLHEADKHYAPHSTERAVELDVE